MPRQEDDLSRNVFLDVSANGAVLVRHHWQRIRPGLLPVFTVDSIDQAYRICARHRRLARDGSGLMFLNEPLDNVDDLKRVADMFREEHLRIRA